MPLLGFVVSFPALCFQRPPTFEMGTDGSVRKAQSANSLLSSFQICLGSTLTFSAPKTHFLTLLAASPFLGPRVLAPVGLSDAVSTLLDYIPDAFKDARIVRVF